MPRRPLGLIISDELKRTLEEDSAARLFLGHTMPHLPASIDMRKKDGKDFTGKVRDQDGCGACVAFSGVKVCAISRRVTDQNADEDAEMSAYDLFSHGGSCGNGWTLEAGGAAFQKYGACPQKCWDDDDDQQPCCAGNKFKTQGNIRLSSDVAVKQWIVDHGAVWAAMDVPDSFFNVDSEEVYHDDGAPIAGAHAVTLCGFDDEKKAWLLYNSWGPMWGVNGFCWIGYGECGLIRSYAAYGIQLSSPGPNPNPDPNPDPNPVPKGDIVLSSDGALRVMPVVVGSKSMSLVVGDKEIPLKSLKPMKYNSIGDFAAGGYDLKLKDSKGDYHNTVISGKGPYWYAFMGKTSAHNYVFLVRFDADIGLDDLRAFEGM